MYWSLSPSHLYDMTMKTISRTSDYEFTRDALSVRTPRVGYTVFVEIVWKRTPFYMDCMWIIFFRQRHIGLLSIVLCERMVTFVLCSCHNMEQGAILPKMTSSTWNIIRVNGPWWHPTLTSGFSSQRPVTWSFGIFFDLRLNIRLQKHWRPHHVIAST